MMLAAVAEPPAQLTVAPKRVARVVLLLAGAGAVIVVVGAWYLSRGEPNIGLGEVWNAVLGRSAPDDIAAFTVRELRLPRLMLALLAGAALGLSGTIMQDALRNPIADPGLLGISQSASLVVAISLLFPGVVPDLGLPALCLIAGLVTGGVLVLVARTVRDPIRLVLIGFVMALFISTLTEIVTLLVPGEGASFLAQFYRFDIGSVSGASWNRLRPVWIWTALAIPLALLSGRTLNVLQLGDDMAASLGMHISRVRLALLSIAVLLVAPVVSVAGPIAFVALLAPHVSRALLRTTNAMSVLPASAAVGAVIVLLADVAGRLAFFPVEIPAGIWTIVLIGPVAILLAGRLKISRSEGL